MTVSPSPFALLADDLTGANAVAAMAADAGFAAWTVLGPAPAILPHADVHFVAVDIATRDGQPKDAVAAITRSAAWLREQGITSVAKRIDTTLRGHIGIEVEALLAALGGGHVAVVVPAFPAAGRTARDGRVFLHGRPLAEITALPDDASRALRASSSLFVMQAALDRVRAGPEAVAAMIASARARRQVLLCDAETDADIDTIAAGIRLTGAPVLPVDPGPLTLAVARTMLGRPQDGAQGPVHARVLPAIARDTPERTRSAHMAGYVPSAFEVGGHGSVFAVFGSAQPAAHEQVERAVHAGVVRVHEIAADAVLSGDVAETARAVCALMGERGGATGIRIEPAGGLVSDHQEVEQSFARVVRAVCAACPPAALYLSGGAVARAVLDALSAEGIRVAGQVQPLAAYGFLAGGPHAGLPVVTKGGLAGTADAVTACLAALTGGFVAT